MVVFGGLWDAAVAVFVVLVLAKYAGVKAGKGLNLVAGAGVLSLLAAASSYIVVAGAQVTTAVETLFSVIGWILLLVGAILATVELAQSK